MHAHQKPIPPSKRVGLELHPELETLVMRCLEKNPNRRPQSARELGDTLAALRFEHPWSEERAELWWKRSLERASTAEHSRSAPAGAADDEQAPVRTEAASENATSERPD